MSKYAKWGDFVFAMLFFGIAVFYEMPLFYSIAFFMIGAGVMILSIKTAELESLSAVLNEIQEGRDD